MFMLREFLGFEQILIEKQETCTILGESYCLETETTQIVNVEFLNFLAVILPFLVGFWLIKIFKKKK